MVDTSGQKSVKVSSERSHVDGFGGEVYLNRNGWLIYVSVCTFHVSRTSTKILCYITLYMKGL